MKKTTTETTQTPVNKKVNQKFETWMTSHWRPLMAYTYMAICIFDFIIGPIMFTAFAGLTHAGLIPWEPLTMDSGGLFHLAMGAILGVAAWTRGVEKVERTRRFDASELGNYYDNDRGSRNEDYEVDDDPFKDAR